MTPTTAQRFDTQHASRTAAPQPWLVPTLTRIKAEYAEMPGLCLTKRQAERLLGLDPERCQHVFDALISIGYLRPSPKGYVRA